MRNKYKNERSRCPKTIYLGFENERMRYANYLWVEAEVVVPNTVYYTTKYTVK
jgi:hypothetical protein